MMFNILSLILYVIAAKMYKTSQTNTEQYQYMAHVIIWSTAYQCGLACEDMIFPTICAVIACVLFYVEWNERTYHALTCNVAPAMSHLES